MWCEKHSYLALKCIFVLTFECVSDVLRNDFKEINEAILWRPDSREPGNGPAFSSFCFPAEFLFDSHSLTPQGIAQMLVRIMSVHIERRDERVSTTHFFLQQVMQILKKITIFVDYVFSMHFLFILILSNSLWFLFRDPSVSREIGSPPSFRYG